MEKKYLTPIEFKKEVFKRTGRKYSIDLIWRHCRDGHLKIIRATPISKLYLIPREELKKFK